MECIKNAIGQVGKPSTLTELKTLAHSINACHWECLCKKSHTEKSNQPNNNKSDKKPQNSNSQQSKPQKSTNTNDKSNKSPGSSTPAESATSDAVTKDGKLTQQERQHCMTNNLCMYCGGIGHKASECSKSNYSLTKAKGRAAKAETPTLTPTAAPASGKA